MTDINNTLFNEVDDTYGAYNKEGIALYKEAEAALVPIFQKYAALGYDTREMQRIIINLTSTIDRIHRATKDPL
jgi:hypothetical protein